MGMEHQQRFSAVQPRRFPSQSVSQYHSGNQPDISEVWQTQLEALLHKYEPGKEHHAHEMLRAYAGMVRPPPSYIDMSLRLRVVLTRRLCLTVGARVDPVLPPSLHRQRRLLHPHTGQHGRPRQH